MSNLIFNWDGDLNVNGAIKKMGKNLKSAEQQEY